MVDFLLGSDVNREPGFLDTDVAIDESAGFEGATDGEFGLRLDHVAVGHERAELRTVEHLAALLVVDELGQAGDSVEEAVSVIVDASRVASSVVLVRRRKTKRALAAQLDAIVLVSNPDRPS